MSEKANVESRWGPWSSRESGNKSVQPAQPYRLEQANRSDGQWWKWASDIRQSQPDKWNSRSSTWHSRERKLNPNFFFSNFSGTPGISRRNPGISRQKSLISLVSRGIPNFLAPTPSCGRPLPHRKISGLKSLGLGSFFVPDIRLPATSVPTQAWLATHRKPVQPCTTSAALPGVTSLPKGGDTARMTFVVYWKACVGHKMLLKDPLIGRECCRGPQS